MWSLIRWESDRNSELPGRYMSLCTFCGLAAGGWKTVTLNLRQS